MSQTRSINTDSLASRYTGECSPPVRESVGQANFSLGGDSQSYASTAITNGPIHNQEDKAEQKTHSFNEVEINFLKCIRLFTDEKINENNVWDMSFIDTTHQLVKSNSKCFDDLEVASLALDVCLKIYSLRVDLLHAEGMQLVSDLRRYQYSKETEPLEADHENPPDEVADPTESDRIKMRKRKSSENLDLINGILDYVVDPIDRRFSNRAATCGHCEINSTTKMMRMERSDLIGPNDPWLKDFSFLMSPEDQDRSQTSELNASQMDMTYKIHAEMQQAPPILHESERLMEIDAVDYGAGLESDDDCNDNLIQYSKSKDNKQDSINEVCHRAAVVDEEAYVQKLVDKANTD